LRRAPHLLLWILLLAGGLSASALPSRNLVEQEKPEYPDLAAKMSLHGMVKLKIWIAPDGKVRRLEYIGGHPVLAESALKAVKNWKYEPLPQESVAIVEVKF
jgi:TonB family protein